MDTAIAIAFLFSVLIVAAVPSAVGFQDYVMYSDLAETLSPGQSLNYDMRPQRLPYGPHSLVLGNDCNLVLTAYGNQVWTTNITVKNGQNCYLSLLPDGELMVRNNIHYPLWRSGAKSVPGKYAFFLNAGGALNVVGPEIWSNTDKETMSDEAPAPTTTDAIFYPGQKTTVTFGIVVTYKNFRLALQPDCNLVLENMNSWEKLWQTGKTSDSGDCFVTMDEWGELFVKHNRREVLWRSGKRSGTGDGANWLVLRYDGRLAVYSGLIWTAGASIFPPTAMAS